MSRRSNFFLSSVIALMATTVWSAPEGGATRIWTMNVGSGTAELEVEKSVAGSSHREALAVSPGEMVEVKRSADESVRIPNHRDLLIVTAPAAFDPAALRVDTVTGHRPRNRREESGQDASPRIPGETQVEPGAAVSSSVLWAGSEPRTVSLRLLAPKAWAEIRIKKPDGTILGYVTLSASRSLDVTVDFGQLLDAAQYWGVVQREVLAHEGQVTTTAAAPKADRKPGSLPRVTAASNGSGQFNYNRNWQYTPALTYKVENGPANTCGEANVSRNGTWEFTPNWLCTDGSGYALKGPWYWANQADDETAEAFIRWPDNSATSTDWHIWDKRCPTLTIESFPPSSWFGFASDPPYGACFGAWTNVNYSTYQDITPGFGGYWPGSGTNYTSGYTEVSSSLNGLPTCGAEWSGPLPPNHTSGHTYKWTFCMREHFQSACYPCVSRTFTY